MMINLYAQLRFPPAYVFLISLLIFCSSSSLRATSVATQPLGYVTVTIAAGLPNSPSTSFVSFPLEPQPDATGQVVGVITGVTVNSVTNLQANWTPNQFSQASSPFEIKMTSGVSVGRTFLISKTTPNTATALTIDSNDLGTSDLTTLISVGDTYKIIPIDTLSSLFGAPIADGSGVIGSTTGAGDFVSLYSPATGWQSYYYDTTSGSAGWKQKGFLKLASDNVVIRPDTGILYTRSAGAAAFKITVVGGVPGVGRKALIYNTGTTVLSNNWPVDMTLGTFGLNNVSGWQGGPSANVADDVFLFNPATGWGEYYYNPQYTNGSILTPSGHWVQSGFLKLMSDNVTIASGSAIIVSRRNSSTGQSFDIQPLPYSLTSN